MASEVAAGEASNAVWRASPLVELHWRDWGDDSVVFEARSGQLFQFDALSAAVMACFEQGPQALAPLTDALAADLCVTADSEFQATVEAIVREFRRLGWLAPMIDR